jgi:cytoskeletal protein RodZ
MLESIGQRLKKERESRYLTLEKASEETRIRVVFLQALEADDYSILPSAAQGRGFLRNYAEYLGLNLDNLIAEIQKNAAPPEVSGPLPEVNLVETEIPITLDADEKSARHFWTGWFTRRAQAESQPEVETAPREGGTEIQPEGEIQPVETNQIEVQDESRSGLISRLASIFRSRIEKPEVESISESEKEEAAPVVESSEPLLPADKIFVEIGTQLRERRELISLTVEEVERHTKLRAAFIRTLEAGEYDKLPSPVQTRGMLANYATFLDIDADTILLRFADGLQARRHEKYAETPREKIQTEVTTSIPRLRSFIAGDLVFGFVMIAVLAALAIWGVGRVISSQETKKIAPTAPSIVDVLGGNLPTQSSAANVTFVPVDEGLTTPTLDALLTLEVTPTFESTANVVVEVFAVERVFVRISVDGKVAFEGRLAPHETRVFEADDQVVILTGNGAALRVKYNGADLGLMGNMGEVISRVYLVTGVATPTATIPPTPTNTPLVTVTPTATATLTPTFTPPPTP